MIPSNLLDASAITPYIREVEIVAQRGHRDKSTEHLLLALLELQQDDPQFVERFLTTLLSQAHSTHLEITPRAFRLSLLTALKLHLRMRGVKDYELFSVEQWKQVVIECVNLSNDEFIHDCLRDVSTVKIYRYIALQILGDLLNHHDHVLPAGISILDGGCSINIGLKCLNDLHIFTPVQLDPDILSLLGNALHPFPIGLACGIDKYPPDLERTLASLFPSEVKIWEELYTTLYYLSHENVVYHQQDILYLNHSAEYHHTFDIVFLSSLLRRFPSHQIADVLVQADYATTPSGFVVINEQMSEDIIEGGGTYATYLLPKYLLERLVSYPRKIINLYELLNIAFQMLIYPDENCTHVFPGKDFYTFLQRLHSHSSSASSLQAGESLG